MGKYKKKTERKLQFMEENLQEAKRRVAQGESKRQVARTMGVNECTLRKRLKQGTVPSSLGRFKTVFNTTQEKELAAHCTDLNARFYGLTRRKLMQVAYQFAESHLVHTRFNEEKKVAGKDWVTNFCKRQGLSLRTPEQCSLRRAMGFNKTDVNHFFGNLRRCFEERPLPPPRIFNMDETGISTVPPKSPKVVSPKGQRAVCKVSAGERGQLVTIVGCVSATGFPVPPAMIFARKRLNPALFNNAPTGTLSMISDSGYMTADLFPEWLKHFTYHVKPTAQDPVLLIVDNHSSHCSLPAVLYCRENFITLLSLPPHTSHKLQPLDVAIFGPLKTAYAAEVEKWMVNHPGEIVSQYDIAGLFRAAYSRVMTVEKAERAFACTGIYPFNPDIFTEEDYVSANVHTALTPIVGGGADLIPGRLGRTPDNEPSTSTSTKPCPTPSANASVSQPGEVGLSPIENPAQKTPSGSRKGGSSEILSGSPFKNKLVDRQSTKKQQPLQKLTKKPLKIVQRQQDNTQAAADETETICAGCGESFADDWVQCGVCHEWWHEQCSDYIGHGPYVCDNC